jgi:hypothetical protein
MHSKRSDWCKCTEHRGVVVKCYICVQEIWFNVDDCVTWMWIFVIGFFRGDIIIIIIIITAIALILSFRLARHLLF